jgi:predicted kinase
MRPTLYLMCGLPGSGKTTVAKRLERDRAVLRLTPDEWMIVLLPEVWNREVWNRPEADRFRSLVEGLQWDVAARALALGINVVLDWGLWSRDERSTLRTKGEALGACVLTCFLDVPMDELLRRATARNASRPRGSFQIDEQDLALWSTWLQRPESDEVLLDLPPP